MTRRFWSPRSRGRVVRNASAPDRPRLRAAMGGASNSLRLRTATLAASLVAAAAVLGAMSAPADAVCVFGFCPKPVSLEFINDSHVPLFVQMCPNGHSSDPRDSRDNPCRVITFSSVVGKGGGRQTYGPFPSLGLIVSPSYPLGVCERAPCPGGATPAKNGTLYFYVENPLVGPPFMRVQGISIVLSENQEVAGTVDRLALVALQRFSDGDNKVMKIVIRQWAR